MRPLPIHQVQTPAALYGVPPPTASRSPLPVNGAGESIWPSLMRLALAMGIAPEGFWRLSWREWQMLTAMPAQASLSRADFDVLMARFPDERS